MLFFSSFGFAQWATGTGQMHYNGGGVGIGTSTPDSDTEKHLPEIPTTQYVKENNIDLGEMNKLLLLKVEELTLYIIQQNERIEQIEKQQKNNKLQKLKK